MTTVTGTPAEEPAHAYACPAFPADSVIARGLAEYDAADAALIVGHRSEALAEILGYAPRGALVHRDHMVML